LRISAVVLSSAAANASWCELAAVDAGRGPLWLSAVAFSSGAGHLREQHDHCEKGPGERGWGREGRTDRRTERQRQRDRERGGKAGRAGDS
jgi:hypothetical protein